VGGGVWGNRTGGQGLYKYNRNVQQVQSEQRIESIER
jgi:hypothetical protein